MIKDWELFLESYDDDDDFDFSKIEEEILKAFTPLFISEALMRPIASKSELKNMSKMLLTSLLTGFGSAISNKDIPDEYKLEMATKFSQFAKEGEEIMVNKSFRDGIIYIFGKFVDYLKNKKMEQEGESWKKNIESESESDSLEDLSKSEIQNLIDDALDRGDFDEVRKLSKYLESNQYVDSPELEEMIDNVIKILVKIIDSIYV